MINGPSLIYLEPVVLFQSCWTLHSYYQIYDVPISVLNRSKNSESIIGEVFDSIIDFKSIFKANLSSEMCSVARRPKKVKQNVYEVHVKNHIPLEGGQLKIKQISALYILTEHCS